MCAATPQLPVSDSSRSSGGKRPVSRCPWCEMECIAIFAETAEGLSIASLTFGRAALFTSKHSENKNMSLAQLGKCSAKVQSRAAQHLEQLDARVTSKLCFTIQSKHPVRRIRRKMLI